MNRWRNLDLEPRSGLFRLEAYGLQSEWVLWRIAQGALDEPELESKAERYQLFEDDFGSKADLAIALKYFDLRDLDPDRAKRIEARR